MILEGILIATSTALIGLGLCAGFVVGRERGRRTAYREGFSDGVDFARNLRRKRRGDPRYSHLHAVDGS
jgi:hypothetical protein